jgi:hypothetical protein
LNNSITNSKAKIKVYNITYKKGRLSTGLSKSSEILLFDGRWVPLNRLEKRISKSDIRDEKLTKIGI